MIYALLRYLAEYDMPQRQAMLHRYVQTVKFRYVARQKGLPLRIYCSGKNTGPEVKIADLVGSGRTTGGTIRLLIQVHSRSRATIMQQVGVEARVLKLPSFPTQQNRKYFVQQRSSSANTGP